MKGALKLFGLKRVKLWFVFFVFCVTPFGVQASQKGIDGGFLEFNFDPNAKLGRLKGLPSAEELGIAEFGLARSVKQKFTFDAVKTEGANYVFPASLKHIIWYAQFDLGGSFKNLSKRKMKVKWYSPGGKIYEEKDFKIGFMNSTYTKTKLELPRPFPEKLLGLWRVRVFKGDVLIDDRYFEVV